MRKYVSQPLGFGVLLVLAVGCGATGDFARETDEPTDPAVETFEFEEAAQETDDVESTMVDSSSFESFEELSTSEVALEEPTGDGIAYDDEMADSSNESIEKEKQCIVQCTVADVGGGNCPAVVSGVGNSKGLFGGSCKKACDRAELDAASSVPAGCLVSCFSEVCSSV